MSVKNQEVLIEAELLADSLKSLAVQYQELVHSAEQGPDAAYETAKRSLDRKFQKLEPRDTIDELRERGLAEAANGLDDLWKAAAMVFNLVAVSIGVDEVKVLDIDIEGPHAAAMNALKRASKQ
jgi:hypothetical protein